jgi:2-polyprenyl-6-hydroxyphenyl methylase/3-demethylubiquinone-9 3-methyltransferase
MELAAGELAKTIMTTVADRSPVACKVCEAPSALFGVVDFHKSCVEARGRRLALSGCPVYYRRCERCGFAFTNDFNGWSPKDFQGRIYNADYVLVDPDFAEVRPTANARLVAESFADSRDAMRILDYGGGDGILAERLRAAGFEASTYDPFSRFDSMPAGCFDLITCFEVMEHVPWPRETVATMAGLLKDEGAILFSTLVQPEEFVRDGLAWWYAAPRNGHISLFSTAALALLFKPLGMKVVSFNAALHMAYRRVPQFARHLRLPE